MPEEVFYTRDISRAAILRVINVAHGELDTDPVGLFQVWMSESGCHADAYNANGGASGIFQAMPATLQILGFPGGPEAFRRLSVEEQIPWAARYYRSYAHRIPTPQLCYLATFLPKYLFEMPTEALRDDFVIAAKAGPLGWAYTANAVFDVNHDYAITLGELGQAIERNWHGPRADELGRRVHAELGVPDPTPTTFPDRYDLRTTRGLQQALAALGFDPGRIDGVPGRNTHDALVSFQIAHHLLADGIPGPQTRKELSGALQTTPPPAD